MHRSIVAPLAGALCLAAALAAAPAAGPAAAAETKALRVCADPFTMPFSNRQQEGFENKIAEVLARDIGARLEMVWWPQRRGILRAMNAGACDVVIGVPKEFDPLLTSKPYYRSAYEIVTRRDSGPKIQSLNDPALRNVKIGVQENSPAHETLAEKGITKNVVGYVVNYNPDQPEASQIIDDVAAGKIDVAIVWGPLAGYYVKRQSVPLEMTPILERDPRRPFVYDFAVGVRRPARDLLPEIDAALARRQADIRKILEDYGVPLVQEAAQ